jgi:hypothetical protein
VAFAICLHMNVAIASRSWPERRRKPTLMRMLAKRH